MRTPRSTARNCSSRSACSSCPGGHDANSSSNSRRNAYTPGMPQRRAAARRVRDVGAAEVEREVVARPAPPSPLPGSPAPPCPARGARSCPSGSSGRSASPRPGATPRRSRARAHRPGDSARVRRSVRRRATSATRSVPLAHAGDVISTARAPAARRRRDALVVGRDHQLVDARAPRARAPTHGCSIGLPHSMASGLPGKRCAA